MNNGSVSERESTKKLFANLATQIGTIVRCEIALANQNLREKILDIRSGLILLVAALFIGFTAFIFLSAAFAIKLSEIMSPSGATFVVGGILIVVSFLLAFFGYRKIK